MENTLLLFCRETHHYSPKMIAHKLGITTKVYFEIERGETLLTYRQAEKLGRLYNTHTNYFYSAAQQLDLLLTRNVILKTATWRIMQLEEKLKTMEQSHKGEIKNEYLPNFKPKSNKHAHFHKPFNGQRTERPASH